MAGQKIEINRVHGIVVVEIALAESAAALAEVGGEEVEVDAAPPFPVRRPCDGVMSGR
jgi:hypothetical protein